MCATNAADSAAPTVRSTSRHAKVARRAAPAPQRDRARILRDVPVAPSDGIRRGGANRADGSALAPLRYASGSGRDAACLVLERRTVPCAACPRRRIPSTWSAVASSALSSSASVASPSRRISGPASSYSEWRATSCASGRRASPPHSDGNPGSWAPRLSRRPLIASHVASDDCSPREPSASFRAGLAVGASSRALGGVPGVRRGRLRERIAVGDDHEPEVLEVHEHVRSRSPVLPALKICEPR